MERPGEARKCSVTARPRVALRRLPIGRALLPIGLLGIPSALPGKGSVLTGGAREVDGRWTGGGREWADLEHQFATVLRTGESKLSTDRR